MACMAPRRRPLPPTARHYRPRRLVTRPRRRFRRLPGHSQESKIAVGATCAERTVARRKMIRSATIVIAHCTPAVLLVIINHAKTYRAWPADVYLHLPEGVG